MSLKKTPLINREISWLYFNERVLQEAADTRLPLIERLKFLGIFSNNLDEFYRVRVATLKRLSSYVYKKTEYSNFNPQKVLDEINDFIGDLRHKFSKIYDNILLDLEKENIFIVNENQLCKRHGDFVKKYFHEKVRTNLFPLMLNNVSELTSLKDKSVYLAVMMRNKKDIGKEKFALIKVPDNNLSRFLVLPEVDGKKYIILLDDVIRYCLKDLFSIFNFDTYDAYTIKFSRDAELDIDNDVAKSFMELISESLKQRKKGKTVRFIYDREMPASMLKIILRKLKVTKKDSIVVGDRYHNFKDFMGFPNIGSPQLEFPPVEPLSHKDLINASSILDVIRKKDVMFHFPYQSFQYIIDVLREASIDPKVESIKMTLYRVAASSNVINALINAARNGKSVTVFLELQARFDEEANINWSKTLVEEGVKVVHGVPELKVHSKLILIKRIEKRKPVLYANISTGNFNEQTAKIYADESLFTSDKRITKEIEKVFEIFENNYKPVDTNNLLLSPFNFRRQFVKLLNNEIQNARKGKEAKVILKINSLVDEDIVKKLYQASNNGVKIDIIARGICVLMPEYKKISENIKAISIVDRFLEHSRIFYFYNAGDEKFFISSADLMKRNMDHRIEVTCPVYDKNIQEELRKILNIQLKDNVKARRLNHQDINKYKTNNEEKIQSQEEIFKFLKNEIKGDVMI